MPKLVTHSLRVAFCRSAKPTLGQTTTGRAPIQTDYADLDVRGLALRVSPGGQKSWTHRYRDRLTGKQSQVTLATFDPHSDGEPDETGVRPLTLHGARIAARQLRGQVDAGLNPALEISRKRERARAMRSRAWRTWRRPISRPARWASTGAASGRRRPTARWRASDGSGAATWLAAWTAGQSRRCRRRWCAGSCAPRSATPWIAGPRAWRPSSPGRTPKEWGRSKGLT